MLVCVCTTALQVGMAVEMHQDDVWWKGLALRTTPAGMHVYMPGEHADAVQQSSGSKSSRGHFHLGMLQVCQWI
jgi:hypothetical protein